MRRNLLLLTLFVLVSGTSLRAGGIGYIHVTTQVQWDSLMEISKQQNLPVFLVGHTSWCGYCKRFFNTVSTDTSVADYFNTHFMNIAVDMEQEFGRSLATRYGIRGYPTLLFLNGLGAQINRVNGYVDPAVLLSYGRRSLRKFQQQPVGGED